MLFPQNSRRAGLLSKLASTGAAFEPFRNPVSADEIRSCEGKLFDLHAELKLLSDLMVVLDARQNQNNREPELLMSLRTSAIYLEQIEKITQEAVEKARTDEGRLLVLKMLNRKLGSLLPELTTKVSELSIDRLESLGEDLLDFQGVGDLESWLG